MRYTTVIDITEFREVYMNKNARMLYLHLALKSGYHDDDRDLVCCSLRAMGEQVGISLSATRHALHVLMKAKLLTKEGDRWRVKKWFVENPPSPRPKPNQVKDARQAGDIASRYTAEQISQQNQLVAAVRACTREELIQWKSELENHKSIIHHGAKLNPNRNSIEWLTKIIERT